MKVIIDGVLKDLHYSIASRMVREGKATLPEQEMEGNEEKKVVKKPGRKKIVKNDGHNR